MSSLIAGALISLFSALPASAQSQTVCVPRAEMVATLADRYGERPVGHGLSSKGFWLELWANQRTGTWTLVATTDGLSCAISVGTEWEQLAVRGEGL